MNKKFEEYIEEVKEIISLSESEKSTMKREFDVFLEHQPSSPSAALKPSPYLFFFQRRYVMPIVAIILLTGGTFTAAEESLPGDILYPLKTDISEKVYETVSFTPKMKAQAHIELTSKRLAELEKMVENNESNQQSLQIMMDSIEDQTEEAVDHVRKLNKNKNNSKKTIEASQALKTVIETHQDILQDLDDKTDTTLEQEAALDEIHEELVEQSNKAKELFEESTDSDSDKEI